jgi:RimJ/RimL family protein N-acetyltransferase
MFLRRQAVSGRRRFCFPDTQIRTNRATVQPRLAFRSAPDRLQASTAEDRDVRSRPARRVRAYCARLDRPLAVVLGYLVDGVPRAVGELKPIAGSRPPAAELAVSVEAPFRGRGVGTELCRRLLVRARNRLIARVHMLCLLDNRRVQRIARGLGGALAFHPGEVEAEIGLPWPQPFSLAEEWLDEVPPRSWPDGRAAGARP